MSAIGRAVPKYLVEHLDIAAFRQSARAVGGRAILADVVVGAAHSQPLAELVFVDCNRPIYHNYIYVYFFLASARAFAST